jgi:lipopolysaccharide biosynthesis protein
MKSVVRAIAFYLPQFHPIPENDEWWGRGFTEWTNVAKAKPLFRGHYQPHLPADLGFYDLRLPDAREAQARLARDYAIEGFCYYHYWFNGKRLLERPFDEVLASGKPDLPFCLCWANENWTRVWDGGEKQILMQQHYCIEDDKAHFRALIPAFKDPRYIRIDDRPLFLVYRAEALPDARATTELWRAEAKRAGLGDMYLARVENYESVKQGANPRSMGFDAEVEFPPFSWPIGCALGRGLCDPIYRAVGLQPKAYAEHLVIPYRSMMHGLLNRPQPGWVRFLGVTPSWDNSPRRRIRATMFPGSTPKLYGQWLSEVVDRTARRYPGEERIVFINAWNEWAEGNHLEPDMEWGLQYLEATREALTGQAAASSVSYPAGMAPNPSMKVQV